MKTLIISINSKYSHTALSVWYLKASLDAPCDMMEFTVNEPICSVFRRIYMYKPDIAAFSCYIWNIEYVRKLCSMLRASMPHLKIILGGPEVSYSTSDIDFADHIIKGEGEVAFNNLIRHNICPPDSFQTIENLDSLPSPYTDEMIAASKGRTIYFESSRGCPFSCSYCLSSTFNGVRFFSIDRVKSELQRLIDAKVPQIKFVDRTFNCNKKRAIEIFRFIIADSSDTTFHFEIAADLLDDEVIELLKRSPCGKIQFEIGVQSVNPQTLEAVNRKTDTGKVLENVQKLRETGNINLHLDLIAGLPHENLESFISSFNQVYKTKPHQLQLGFLKLLKGAAIRDEDGFVYADFPPYEIISNSYITAEQIILLKDVEDVVDRYYNSCRFTNTLEYLAKEPFEFYCRLSRYVDFSAPPSADKLYNTLADFVSARGDKDFILELLKLDFLSGTRFGKLPDCLTSNKVSKDACFEYLKARKDTTPAKERYKSLHFEEFSYGVLMFDYSRFNPVTNRYHYEPIDL